MKKALSLVLAIVMILSSLMTLTVSSASYMIGDLDNDGIINGKDGNILKRCIAGATIIDDTRCADINKSVTIFTVILINALNVHMTCKHKFKLF